MTDTRAKQNRSDYTTSLDVARLVDELFGAVQGAQGYAHVSDGETFTNVPDFFARIRGRLRWSEEATRLIRDFLKKYDQQPKIGRPLKSGPPLRSKSRLEQVQR